MRRITAVASLAAFVALGAGCSADGGSASGPSAGTSAGSTSTGSARPTVDPSAEAVCADLKNTVLDDDAKAFGAELGRMVAYRAQGKTQQQEQARAAAAAKLREIAGKLRAHATSTTDTALRDALTKSADNLDRLAGDASYLSGVTSLASVSSATQRFVESMSDVARYCAD